MPSLASETFFPVTRVVNRDNFQRELPALLASIARAQFVAIDCEMSGLWRAKWLAGSELDSLDSRWARVRDSGVHMGLLQYGVCAFEWDGARGAFIARPYSFHLLPREESGLWTAADGAGAGGDAIFHASSSTVTFLRSNGFNLSQWAEGGLSFLSREAEAQLRHAYRLRALRRAARLMEEGQQGEDGGAAAAASAPGERPRVVVERPPAGEGGAATAAAAAPEAPLTDRDVKISRPADVQWYDQMVAVVDQWQARVAAWRAGTAPGGGGGGGGDATAPLLVEEFPASYIVNEEAPPGVDAPPSAAAPASFPYLVLPPMNGFRRRVVHTLAEARWGGASSPSVRVQSRASDQPAYVRYGEKAMRIMWVGEGTPGFDAWQRCELRRGVGEVDELLARAVGFRAVIDGITAARVPVVGHNCWLDLSHTTAKFAGAPKRDVGEWAAQLQGVFPTVYDTKLLIAGVGDAAVDPVTSAAFRSDNALERAYAVALGTSTVDVFVPSEAPQPPPPGTEGGAPAPPPPLLPQQQKRWGGGAGGRAPSQQPMEKLVVTVPWSSLVPIAMAEGFGGSSGGGEGTPAANSAGEAVGAHDAGYDAFMTGVVFARVAARLCAPQLDGSATVNVRLPPEYPAPAALPALLAAPPTLLRALQNSLFVMSTRSSAARCLNLAHAAATIGGDGAAPARNALTESRAAAYRADTVHVGGLDLSVASEDLCALFAEALGIEAKLVAVTRVDDGSAFVVLPTAEHAAAAVAAAAASGGSGATSASSEESGGGGGGLFQRLVETVTGSPGGDNMLALGGESAEVAAARAEARTAVKRARREAADAACALELASLSTLPPSAFTPALAARVVGRLRLADFALQTYGEWLAEHRDVFGGTCDHEVTPRVYAVAAGGGNGEGGGTGGKRDREGGGILQTVSSLAAGLFGGGKAVQ
jgi:hypothetical protein